MSNTDEIKAELGKIRLQMMAIALMHEHEKQQLEEKFVQQTRAATKPVRDMVNKHKFWLVEVGIQPTGDHEGEGEGAGAVAWSKVKDSYWSTEARAVAREKEIMHDLMNDEDMAPFRRLGVFTTRHTLVQGVDDKYNLVSVDNQEDVTEDKTKWMMRHLTSLTKQDICICGKCKARKAKKEVEEVD